MREERPEPRKRPRRDKVQTTVGGTMRTMITSYPPENYSMDGIKSRNA